MVSLTSLKESQIPSLLTRGQLSFPSARSARPESQLPQQGVNIIKLLTDKQVDTSIGRGLDICQHWTIFEAVYPQRWHCHLLPLAHLILSLRGGCVYVIKTYRRPFRFCLSSIMRNNSLHDFRSWTTGCIIIHNCIEIQSIIAHLWNIG
jgi:hypothetical protein